MTTTYIMMLLFVFWALCEIRFLGIKLTLKESRSLSGYELLEIMIFAALGTFFFHNVW